MKIRFGCWFLFVFMMVGSACSSQKSSPRFRIVDGVVVDPVRDRKTITPGKLDSSEVRAQINFKKANNSIWKYDERSASYKKAFDKISLLPPELLVAIADCCWATGSPL